MQKGCRFVDSEDTADRKKRPVTSPLVKMAERICRNFAPNVFNKNKCQNCYKLREAHTTTGVHFQEYSFDSEPRRSPVAKVWRSNIVCNIVVPVNRRILLRL